MNGLPKQRDADASRHAIALLASIVVLCVLAVAIQMVVVFGFSMYCGENLIEGTDRTAVCDRATEWGYAAMLVLPALAVLVAGMVAYPRGRLRLLWWTFAVAVGAGIAIPLSARIVAGY